MPIAEAKQILKSESQKLKNISFGPKTSYAFRKKSLVDHDGKLVSINVWSKKNLTLLEAETYLKECRKHFESNKYKTVYAQENWSKPVLVKKNLPCIRFVDSDKTTVVEVDPRGQGGVYNVFVTFYDYKWFLKKARGK
jgi:NMD protein affecting ribosome stability and mRNA decay